VLKVGVWHSAMLRDSQSVEKYQRQQWTMLEHCSIEASAAASVCILCNEPAYAPTLPQNFPFLSGPQSDSLNYKLSGQVIRALKLL